MILYCKISSVILCLYLLFNVPSLANSKSISDITNDMVAKALSGDRNARFTIATILNDPDHPLYLPDKAVGIFKSLADNGDSEAFEPLAEHYSDPLSAYYAPHRAMFYYKRLQASPNKLSLLSFLSHKTPLEPKQTNNLRSDPYDQLLAVFSHFPFEEASKTQREMLSASLQLVEAKPFLAYLLPPFALPVVADTHLLSLARTVRDKSPLNELRWQYDVNNDIYIPLHQTNGVEFVHFFFDNEAPNNRRLTDISIAYPIEAYTQLSAYYRNLLPYAEDDVFYGEGIRAKVHRTLKHAMLDVTFANVPALILPSKKADAEFQPPQLMYTQHRQ